MIYCLKQRSLPFLFLLILLMLNSCIGYKKTLYFNAADTMETSPDPLTLYTLRPGDIVKVNFVTPDEMSSQMFDVDSKSVANASPASIYMSNYSVDDSGYVDIPLAGKILAKGKTIMHIDSVITLKSEEYFKYSTIDVKLVSFKFLVLGEVKNPGYTFVFNNKCTIYEAIGLAGDATDYANKKKVTVIRKTPEGKDIVYHLDLTAYDVYNSPVYYIWPHDVIYIQPQKAKVDSRNIQYVTLGFAAISTVFLLINFIKK
jgi:polysaccharide export outer membrane protein